LTSIDFRFVGLIRALKATQNFLHSHHRTVLGSAAAILLGTGATAFAVANLVPDVATVPVREVLEAVEVAPSQDAKPSAAEAGFTLYRSDITRSNDTADVLLRRLNIFDPLAAAFLRKDATAYGALLERAGRGITAEADNANRLIKLNVRWPHENETDFNRLVVEKTATGFTSRIETAPLLAGTRLASGTIRSSLFAATDDARIPDAVAVQIAEIFSGDIDFIRALRKGDRFSVVYETLQADGEPMRSGKVLSAEFVNSGKTYQAVLFKDVGSTKGSYFTLEGNSLRKAFLASPLEFSRITSGFGMRVHPIARDWRAHKGVDYAAPIGTAIRSVGDGVVEFAGTQRGYGNVVEIAHRDGKNTVYAHMNSIAVRKGQRVEQGDNIGAVGRTGWATGPHLHFEFRVKGEHHDPRTIAQDSNSVPVSAAGRPAFNRMAQGIRVQLGAASSLLQASAQ
jgi:murein DD-endopeptidase MepM/ murein hydrolase activator NlpD